MRVRAPSLLARLTAASVFSYERLYTEIGKPFSATLSARFCARRAAEHGARRGALTSAGDRAPHLAHNRQTDQTNLGPGHLGRAGPARAGQPGEKHRPGLSRAANSTGPASGPHAATVRSPTTDTMFTCSCALRVLRDGRLLCWPAGRRACPSFACPTLGEDLARSEQAGHGWKVAGRLPSFM